MYVIKYGNKCFIRIGKSSYNHNKTKDSKTCVTIWYVQQCIVLVIHYEVLL